MVDNQRNVKHLTKRIITMGFQTISVKEAVTKVNADRDGWFLPAIQRPYVWGSRYESEKYICKLFDSILNGYPIGTLIVWNTDKGVPYRKFMDDYEDGKIAKIVDKALWDRADKWLVYDGQQRLQTLYSCLKSTLNKRVLAYNLLYESNDGDEEYGFEFVDKNSDKPGYIKIPVLFAKTDAEKVNYRNQIKRSLEMTEEQETIFENRFDKLWTVFAGTDVKSLAYFPIDNTWNEDKVNDVFQRLNTGGVPLSGADLLFSKIKETEPSFEENLLEVSKWITEVTNGYTFSANEILQLINLIVKGTSRIDASKVKTDEIQQFKEVGSSIGALLKDFFAEFFYNTFNINNSAIISRKLAVLPLIVYSYLNYKKGKHFSNLSSANVNKMKQYFILSQLNDWNTQGIVENSARIMTDDDFPLDKIKQIASRKNRLVDLRVETIECNVWFALKVMLPGRLYVKQTSTTGRYKPELDHIFPMRLKNRPEGYYVDILWNLQPVSGKTNLEKSNMHPHEFFSTKGHIFEYDFLPCELTSAEWKNHQLFIAERKKRMLDFMEKQYNLKVVDNSGGTNISQ
mgnify:CR=1 FL=1